MANLATIDQNILADSGIDPINFITGTGVAGQVTYWDGTTALAGNNNLFWNNTLGRLAIGKTNAQAIPTKLYVAGATGSAIAVSSDFAPGSNASPIPLDFTFLGYGNTELARIRTNDTSSNNNSGDLSFSTRKAGALSENARFFLNTGNFGINTGTTDYGTRLQVVGTGYFSDSVGIGINTLTGSGLKVSKQITGQYIFSGGSFGVGVLSDGTIMSDEVGGAAMFRTVVQTQAATFSAGTVSHYEAVQGTLGAGSSIGSQVGFFARETLIGGTNNFGFYGNIPAGTNRWNLYMNGTANNYMAGALGIGTTSLSFSNLRVSRSITGATTALGVSVDGAILQDVTSQAVMFNSAPSTQAISFALGTLSHFSTNGYTAGAFSVVTNQYGFIVGSGLTSATNNYGFWSGLVNATGRWNFYANGDAPNYFAGDTYIGNPNLRASDTSIRKLIITGSSATLGPEIVMQNETAADTSSHAISFVGIRTNYSVIAQMKVSRRGIMTFHTQDIPSAVMPPERMRINAIGNVGINTINPVGKLHVNVGTDLNLITSTQLSSVSLEAANDAYSANVPFIIYGNPIRILGGNLILNDSTTNTGERLQVTGAAKITSTITAWAGFTTYTGDGLFNANAAPSKILLPNTGNQILFGYYSAGDGIYHGRIGVIASNTDKVSFGAFGPNIFTINTGTANTERLRIDAVGNMGLGIAPSAWSTLLAFQVSRGSISATTAELDISHNAFYDGAWKYMANGFATNHYTANGAYFWRTAANNTGGAGAAITFTQAMVLDASSNLSVAGNIGVNGLTLGRGPGNLVTNTVFGAGVMTLNTTGFGNLALGYFSLYNNTTGYYNLAAGYDALYSNTDGFQNIALGFRAAYTNTSGDDNIAIGYRAGWAGSANGNTTGNKNIFIGYETVGVAATDSNRTFIGGTTTTSTWLAGNLLLGSTTDGGERLQVTGNARISGTSLFEVTDAGVGTKTIVATFGRTGATATGTAREAGIVFRDASGTTLVGGMTGVRENSGGNYLGGLKLYVSSNVSTQSLTFADLTTAVSINSVANVGIGIDAPLTRLHVAKAIATVSTTTLADNTAVGLNITYPDTTLVGGEGVALALGMNARGRSYIASVHESTSKDATALIFYNTNGAVISERFRIAATGNAFMLGNMIVGSTADSGQKLQVTGTALITGATTINSTLTINTSGQGRTISTYYGADSLGFNIFIGGGGVSSIGAVGLTFQGSYNTSLGVEALLANTTGYYNVAVGYRSLYANTTGYQNTASGYFSLNVNTDGFRNSSFGINSLVSNTTGSNNVAVGFRAGFGGSGSTTTNTTGSNNIFIGSESVGVSSTESNRTWIGNTLTTSTWLGGNLLLGSTTDGGQRLQVNGTALITGNTEFSGAISMGINIFTSGVLRVYSTIPVLSLQNPTTGSGNTDGFQLSVSGANGYAWNYENAAIFFGTNNTERVRIKPQGQVRFAPLASDPTGQESGDVYYNSTTNVLKYYNGSTWNDMAPSSSSYTPTLTAVTNVASSTASVLNYFKNGSMVHIIGKVTMTASAAGTTRIAISLPIASNFTANDDAVGFGDSGLTIISDVTNDRLELEVTATSTISTEYGFMVTYVIK